ncbi:hypothetical protein PHLCEN_2v10570 [Hermanssonia centrifuga]|uniref:Uncharacterized protein n=1 Tax=Hermanssonia centrifuga TaxID=98765 RepID=A0A2R6NMQ5_9APHY|nr:hypothetical protein PHLCEN_2v10570 [Hermanssonia centrifuga]
MADPGKCVECVGPECQVSSTDVLPSEEREEPTLKAEDPLDSTTFAAPSALPLPSIAIEFCDRVCLLSQATGIPVLILSGVLCSVAGEQNPFE